MYMFPLRSPSYAPPSFPLCIPPRFFFFTRDSLRLHVITPHFILTLASIYPVLPSRPKSGPTYECSHFLSSLQFFFAFRFLTPGFSVSSLVYALPVCVCVCNILFLGIQEIEMFFYQFTQIIQTRYQ